MIVMWNWAKVKWLRGEKKVEVKRWCGEMIDGVQVYWREILLGERIVELNISEEKSLWG